MDDMFHEAAAMFLSKAAQSLIMTCSLLCNIWATAL